MSILNKTQGGRNEMQESQPPLNSGSGAPAEERPRLRRRPDAQGSQFASTAPNTNTRSKLDNRQLATRNENGTGQGASAPSKPVSDTQAIVNHQDKGMEGRDVERSTRSFRIDQVTPEDDINAALSNVSSDAQLMQLLQHLESSQLKTTAQLAAVRNRLKEKGSGGETLLQLEGGSSGGHGSSVLAPKGYSLEVMSGAYKESKANENYIKKRWNMDIDLTSHFSSAAWVKPAALTAPVDRRSEDGEIVRGSDKRQERPGSRKDKEKEKKRRTPSRSRSRSRSRKKSRRHSPRGRRRSRSRSKSRSPLRHRKYHSPGSDGSGPKRTRGRSRSPSFRSKFKGRDLRDLDPPDAKSSSIKGPTRGGNLRGSGTVLKSSEPSKAIEGSGAPKAKPPTQTPQGPAKAKAVAQPAQKVSLQAADLPAKAPVQVVPGARPKSSAQPAAPVPSEPKSQPLVRPPAEGTQVMVQPPSGATPSTLVPPSVQMPPPPSTTHVLVPPLAKMLPTTLVQSSPVPPPPLNPPGTQVPSATRVSNPTPHPAALPQKLSSQGAPRPPLPQAPPGQMYTAVPSNQAPTVQLHQVSIDAATRALQPTLRPPPQAVSSSPTHFSSPGMLRPGFRQGPHPLVQRPPVPARSNGFTQPGPLSPWPNQTLRPAMEHGNAFSGGMTQWLPGINLQQSQDVHSSEAPRLEGSGRPLVPAPVMQQQVSAPLAQQQQQQQARRRGGTTIVYQSPRPTALRPVGLQPTIVAGPTMAAAQILSGTPQAVNTTRLQTGVVNGINSVTMPVQEAVPVAPPVAIMSVAPPVQDPKDKEDKRWGPAGQKPGVQMNAAAAQKAEKTSVQGKQPAGGSESDDDGRAFAQPNPVPPPVKAPTLKVFKGPPPLLMRSKHLAHDPLTMCAAMRLVSERVSGFRKVLWKLFPPEQKVPRVETPVLKLVPTVKGLDESMLNLCLLRENQKLFRQLAGAVATTSTKLWNKVDARWVLCPSEITGSVCKGGQCLYQHKSDTEMAASEKNQELSQYLSQQSQHGASVQTSFSWPVPTSVVKKMEKQRGLEAARVMPGRDRILSCVDGKAFCKMWGQTQVFKTNLLSGATYLSNEALESCKLYRDLAGFTPTGLILGSTGCDSHNSSLLRDSSIEAALMTAREAAVANSFSGARSLTVRARIMTLLKTCLEGDAGKSRRDLRLWLAMLAMWSRQPSIPKVEKAGMLERVAKEHGSCYQIILWLAAEERDPKQKIAVFKDGISILNRAAKISDYNISREDCIQQLGPCVVDLALKVLHLSMCSQEGIVEGAKNAVTAYANVQPVDDLLEMDSDDWMLVTLQVSHRFPTEAAVMWLSLVHCVVFDKMPDAVVHRFGYPQLIETIRWDLADVSLDRLRLAREIFLYASSNKLGGLNLASKPSSVKELAAKECIAFNIMRFDMAMNYSSRQGAPLLCQIFPGDEARSATESSDDWKSMLCESSWKASCCLSAQDDSDSEADTMEVDGGQDKEGMGAAKSLVAQGMVLHYVVVKEKKMSRFWRRQVASMWTDFEENDDGMGPFRNLHLQQSLWLRHAMTALEQDNEGPAEAYLVLTNGACNLMPISEDKLPNELSALKESTQGQSQAAGMNDHMSPKKAFLCYKILLEPDLRQLYLESRNGLEDGEVMDPSCMNWTSDELAAGWINCALAQLLGGAFQNVYPCFRKALNACSGNRELRLQWWSEILTCICGVLGPVEQGCKESGENEDQHRARGRWSGWQASHAAGSTATEHELCMPSFDAKAKLDVSKSMMDARAKTFKVFKTLVLEVFEEVAAHGRVEGLVLPKVHCGNSKMREILAPSSAMDLMPIVAVMRPQLKSLTQGEIVSLVEILVEKYPTSPAMAIFVLDAASLLPGHNLACCWIPALVTVLLSAKPPVSPDLWMQSIQVVEAYSKASGKELAEQALLVHPYMMAIRKLKEQ